MACTSALRARAAGRQTNDRLTDRSATGEVPWARPTSADAGAVQRCSASRCRARHKSARTPARRVRRISHPLAPSECVRPGGHARSVSVLNVLLAGRGEAHAGGLRGRLVRPWSLRLLSVSRCRLVARTNAPGPPSRLRPHEQGHDAAAGNGDEGELSEAGWGWGCVGTCVVIAGGGGPACRGDSSSSCCWWWWRFGLAKCCGCTAEVAEAEVEDIVWRRCWSSAAACLVGLLAYLVAGQANASSTLLPC